MFFFQAYTVPYFELGYGQKPFIKAGCPINTCFTTSDRKMFPETELDAVIWHLRDKDRTLPNNRLVKLF